MISKSRLTVVCSLDLAPRNSEEGLVNSPSCVDRQKCGLAPCHRGQTSSRPTPFASFSSCCYSFKRPTANQRLGSSRKRAQLVCCFSRPEKAHRRRLCCWYSH